MKLIGDLGSYQYCNSLHCCWRFNFRLGYLQPQRFSLVGVIEVHIQDGAGQSSLQKMKGRISPFCFCEFPLHSVFLGWCHSRQCFYFWPFLMSVSATTDHVPYRDSWNNQVLTITTCFQLQLQYREGKVPLITLGVEFNPSNSVMYLRWWPNRHSEGRLENICIQNTSMCPAKRNYLKVMITFYCLSQRQSLKRSNVRTQFNRFFKIMNHV